MAGKSMKTLWAQFKINVWKLQFIKCVLYTGRELSIPEGQQVTKEDRTHYGYGPLHTSIDEHEKF